MAGSPASSSRCPRPSRCATSCWSARSQSGKTTLVEALLLASGALPGPGSVADHNTVCDFDESEQLHERSSSLAVAPVRARRLQDQPARHPRLRRLRRRGAGGPAGGGLRAVRGGGQRGGRREHPPAVARVRRGRHAAGRGGDQARPRPRRLRRARCARPGRRSATGCCRSSYPRAAGSPGCWTAPPTTSAAAALIEAVIEESEDESLMDRYLGGEQVDEELLVARPGEGGGRGAAAPGAGRLRHRRPRVRRAARPVRPRLPGPVRSTRPRSRYTPSGGRRGTVTCDPDGPLVAEVVQDEQRPVRRAGQHRAGLLRDAGPRRVGARLGPLLRLLRRRRRPRGPRRGRAHRRAGAPVRAAPAAGRPGGRRRHRRDRAAEPRRDRRHPVQPRPAAGAASRGRCRRRCCPWPSRRVALRRGQAVHRARPAAGRGPEPADRAEPRDRPGGAVGDGRGPRRAGARPAAQPLRRGGRPVDVVVPLRETFTAPAKGTAGT